MYAFRQNELTSAPSLLDCCDLTHLSDDVQLSTILLSLQLSSPCNARWDSMPPSFSCVLIFLLSVTMVETCLDKLTEEGCWSQFQRREV
jgi:hypothetical protein